MIPSMKMEVEKQTRKARKGQLTNFKDMKNEGKKNTR